MKNKLIITALCMMLMAALAGCGGQKDSDQGNSKDNTKIENNQDQQKPENDDKGTSKPDEDFSIAMTDSYTFTDPEDMDFDQRHVLVGDPSAKLLSDMTNFGFEVTAMYDIVYVKDGKPAGEYQYFVAKDEENAVSLKEFYESQGQKITQEGNIIYAVVDGDVLDANIIMLSSMNAISGETPEAYLEYMKSFNGLTDYK